MAYNDLREWIAALDKAGELKRVKAEGDPILEIAEITDRVSKWDVRGERGPGGPALLFENLTGYPGWKLLINQFGSERRMNLALETRSLDDIADRLRHLLEIKPPQGFLDKLKMLPTLAELGSFFPKLVSSGPCKEVILRNPAGTAGVGKGFSLFDFPVLQCWPQDGGRFITLPCVISRDPRTGSATSACTACSSTTPPRPACTGSGKKSRPSTTASACAAPRRRIRMRKPQPRLTSWPALAEARACRKGRQSAARWR